MNNGKIKNKQFEQIVYLINKLPQTSLLFIDNKSKYRVESSVKPLTLVILNLFIDYLKDKSIK